MAGMDFEAAERALKEAYDDLMHLTEHYSAIVAGIAEARVKVSAVASAGFFPAELDGVVQSLNGASAGTKTAGDAVSIARYRLKRTTGGPPDGIVISDV